MPPDFVESQSDVLMAARAGSPDALGQLFTRHAGVVHRVALRLTSSEDDAQDIVQDVFVGLPEALRNYHEHGTFEAWLKRVSVRCTLMHMRSAMRRERREAGDAAFPQADPDPGTRMSLAQAIAVVPEKLRLVFVLHDVEGYSHAEIGGMLGIRTGTSQVRLFRARALLRSVLEDKP
jgi:RNA polymerase sigma-70 factor (ECF subfamily)